MKMLLRARAGGQSRLGQALIADGGIAVRQQFADFRAVLGDERRDLIQIFDVHKFSFVLVLVLVLELFYRGQGREGRRG